MRFSITFTTFALLFLISKAPVSAQSVFQSWNEIQLIVPLMKGKDTQGKTVDRVTATFSGIGRFGRSADLVDGRLGANIDIRINKHLSLLGGLVYRRDEIVKKAPHYETRIDLGATLSTVLRDFTIRDRNMFERRLRNRRTDTSLYRNKVHISHPVRRADKVLFTPFLADEVYYDITNRRWAQNEFLAGISRNLGKNTALDIAYLRAAFKPVNVNGLSLTLKIKLR